MIRAGDYGHIAVRFVSAIPDNFKGITQVLLRGSRSRLHENPFLRQPVLYKPVMHGPGLRDLFAFAHAAGNNGNGIRISVQIIQGTLQPPYQREGGAFTVDGGTEYDKIGTFRLRIGTGIPDDRNLNDAEIHNPETGQTEHDAPEQYRQETVGENERDQEKAEITPVDIAAKREAEEESQRSEHCADDDPDRVFFLLLRFLIRFHCSGPPIVHTVP